MLKRLLIPAAALGVIVQADTLVLRTGRLVDGDYLGGSPRSIRMQVSGRSEEFDINNVSEIRFGSASSASASSRSSSDDSTLTPRPRERNDLGGTNRNASSPSSSRREVPAGTAITIRMIDDVDSQRDSVGATYRASVDEAVTVNGEVIVPRDADVMVKLIDDKESGRLSGRTELTLDLVSIKLNGRNVDVLSQEVTQASESRTGRTGKVVGGGAALGAIIGAIAGGGKGAAIGALGGAAAGGAVQVATKGQRVRIPSETRLSFTLQQSLRP